MRGFVRFLLLSGISICLYAQGDRGTITGLITDPSGARYGPASCW